MSFSRVIGQRRAVGILNRALEHRRVAHAYLFSGPEGVGKEALAVEFAKALLCKSDDERPCDHCSNCRRVAAFQHPDFFFLFPSEKDQPTKDEAAVLVSITKNPYARKRSTKAAPQIHIEKIRELRRTANFKPLEGRQVFVIAEADKMTTAAANALLKLLEEPPATLTLILTVAQTNALLPTIVSRCQEIRLGPLTDAEIEWALVEREAMPAERAQLLARISQGSYRRALEWAQEDFAVLRERVIEFLRICLRDPLKQFEWIESFDLQKDKKTIKDILNLMLIWFRDAMILHDRPDDQTHLVNIDDFETLTKFVGAFESVDFDAAYKEIERSIQMIERNIQVQLVLIVLMSRLKRSLKLKGRST